MSAVGPAIFRVNAILSAQTTSFEDALPQLRQDLALARAAELVQQEMEPLDDELAGGATLEELAADSPMQIGTVTWDAQSEPADAPATEPEFYNAAAALADGDFPEITLADSGTIFAMRLDSLAPSELQPLGDVRAEAEAGAAEAKRIEALEAEGEALKARLAAGEDFAIRASSDRSGGPTVARMKSS